MKKIVLLVPALVVSGVVAGCAVAPGDNGVTGEPPATEVTSEPPTTEATSEPPESETAPAPATHETPAENVTWSSPGKVQVGNFHPGARAEWTLTLHNGNEDEASFLIAYKQPDNVQAGYQPAPAWCQDWVIIADPTPVLAPRETREILIALDMPTNAQAPEPKWEFWVSVKDTSQGGMVQVELCSRWLVSMR